jgi:hypothetical protein
VWHVKEPSLLKAVSAKHRSKFAAPSPVMVSRQIAEKLLMRLKTNTQRKEYMNCPQKIPFMSRVWVRLCPGISKYHEQVVQWTIEKKNQNP